MIDGEKRKRGTCSGCRKQITLTKSGNIRCHPGNKQSAAGDCSGSLNPPVKR